MGGDQVARTWHGKWSLGASLFVVMIILDTRGEICFRIEVLPSELSSAYPYVLWTAVLFCL